MDKIKGYLMGKGANLKLDSSEEEVLQALDQVMRSNATAQTPPPAASPIGFVEPLLGCDPAQVTPGRAGAIFTTFVNQLCRDEGCDYTKAWNKAKTIKPELYNRFMNGDADKAAQPSAATLANDGPAPLVNPAQKVFMAAALHLPPAVDDQILAEAFKANGSQVLQVNAQQVFMGVCSFIARSQQLSVANARRVIFDQFPGLWNAAGQGAISG